jgi:cyclophilin family peptidyl-prolyl cis-trans isomerase/HEAT repeat protein
MLVCLVQFFQIPRVRVERIAFKIARTVAKAADEYVGRGLEVNHEVRRRDVLREEVVESLVDEELVIVEIEIREDLVLVEQVIADGGLREEVALLHGHLLPMAVEQVEELGLERSTGASAVKVGKERILRLFENRGGIESSGQTLGKRALSDTDGPFNRDVLKRHGIRSRSVRPEAACYHREPMYKAIGKRHAAFGLTLIAALVAASCATAPPPAPTVPVIRWEQKIGWMVRLEDQRLLRDPNPPAPVVLRPATPREPAVVAPAPPSDLIKLLNDTEARVRRRAALAIGRVGLPEGVEPLTKLLDDGEIEVRQMAAFALGLIGDRAARPALLGALRDPQPVLQGRAAEALGQIGDRADGDAISAMVQGHVKAGALMAVGPDDVTYPLSPPIEAVRLGLYALARLGAYDALAAAVLVNGQPVSTWWPVAYALQRVGDPRAAPALMTLVNTPGRFTASFAVKGLGSSKATQGAQVLRQIVEQRKLPQPVVIQAVRSLTAIRDTEAVPILTKMVADASLDPTLRQEAVSAFGTLVTAQHVDLLLDLVSSATPGIRAAALQALARVDPDTFLTALASLEADREWNVRVAVATALGTLPAARSLPRLTVMLQDTDQKVISAVLGALAASQATGVERILLDRLASADLSVRIAAANALADLKIASAAQPLADAYRRGSAEDSYTARAAALGALARLDPAAARPVLLEALKDRDWAVRVRAIALLNEQKVTGQDEATRPATAGRAIADPQWQAIVSPPYSPRAFIDTDKGTIELELAVIDAPVTVANFIALARKGFFRDNAIHRLVPDFVVQAGDPRGDGEGGPGYTIRDELNQLPYLRGTVGMALDWEDTGGSQFFITHSPQPHLDARYTAFGRVVSGMDVVDRLVQWDVIRNVRIRDGVNPE